MIKRETVHKLRFKVRTVKQDILTAGMAGCRRADKCMERVAIARTLYEKFGVASHASRVRVDAGNIRFNYDGYRWIAHTPKVAAKALKDYDRITSDLKENQVTEENFDKLVARAIAQHEYTIIAERSTKIVPISRERQDQVNEARRKRGGPVVRYTLRDRVIGHR